MCLISPVRAPRVVTLAGEIGWRSMLVIDRDDPLVSETGSHTWETFNTLSEAQRKRFPEWWTPGAWDSPFADATRRGFHVFARRESARSWMLDSCEVLARVACYGEAALHPNGWRCEDVVVLEIIVSPATKNAKRVAARIRRRFPLTVVRVGTP